MKRKMKVTLSLLLVVAMVFGNGFTSFAVSTPAIQNLKGETTGVSAGNFSWNLDINAPYIFDGYEAALNGSSYAVPSNQTVVSLTGLHPGTNYKLDLKAKYHQITEHIFEVEKITKVDLIDVPITIYSDENNMNFFVQSKVEGSWGTNPRLFFADSKKDGFSTIEEAVRVKYKDYTFTFIAPFVEHFHSGWRDEIIPEVTYIVKKEIKSITYKYLGVTYSTPEEAIEKAIEDFDETLFDSYEVVPLGDFNENNILQIKILGRNNYETESYSADFTTKAWSTVTVKFHSDYNQPSDIVKKYDETVVSLPTPADVEGYRFMGWFNEPTFDTSFDGTVSYTEPYDTHTTVDVYAKWYELPLSTFTVNFFVDGNKEDSDTVAFEEKSIEVPADPTKSGFEFEGWFYENGVEVDFGNIVDYANKYEGDYVVDVYAQWIELGKSSFKLIYMLNGAEYYIQSFTHGDNKAVVLPPNPNVSGYEFIRWEDADNEEANFGTIVQYGNPYEGRFSATVYAKLEKLSTFTVNYYDKDSKLIDSETLTYPNTELSKGPKLDPIPGFEYKGWTEKDSTVLLRQAEVVKYAEKFNGEYSIDLYANYEALPLSKLTIMFDSRGGSSVEPIVFVHPDKEFKVPTTTRQGFNFAGWYYMLEDEELVFDENFTFEYPQPYRLEGSFTVYAKWTAVPPQPPTPPTPPTPEPTTAAPTTQSTEELDEEEPVALSAPIEFFNIDQYLVEPTYEEVVEIEIDEPTPLGSALPQTGQLPAELFYGIGVLITAAGAFMKKR